MTSQPSTDFDTSYLRQQVVRTYTDVARNPHGNFHFHRGLDYAVNYLGYDRVALQALPVVATSRFAGVGNPLAIPSRVDGARGIRAGDTVLDHACGAGMDLLLAAQRIGAGGYALGFDLTGEMRDCAQRAAHELELSDHFEVRFALYEQLPVNTGSVDVVISNGVVNLAPDKPRVFAEIARVLKPGGELYLADVIVQRPLKPQARNNPDLWAACIGGAMTEQEMPLLMQQAGLTDIQIVQRFNCFQGTSAEEHVAKDLFVHAVNVYARKAS